MQSMLHTSCIIRNVKFSPFGWILIAIFFNHDSDPSNLLDFQDQDSIYQLTSVKIAVIHPKTLANAGKA